MVFRRHTPGWFSLPFQKKAVPFCVVGKIPLRPQVWKS